MPVDVLAKEKCGRQVNLPNALQARSQRPDVVIAYARTDRGALADCAGALARRGYVVWWDLAMTAGRKWRDQFDEQVDRARKVIVIWSEAAAKSKEVAREMAFAYGQRKLVPLCIDNTPPDSRYNELDHKQILDFDAEIDEIVEAIEFEPIQLVPAPAEDFDIELGDLPRAPAALFGREVEVDELLKAWNSAGAKKKNVFVLHGLGGAGKSSLVSSFIEELRERGYEGARRVYAWSAYSQGANRRADAGTFFADALAFFGHTGAELTDQVAQARALSKIIQKERSLLVLDGLEPLQGAPKDSGGKLKDKALATLIKRLADHNPGLVVITSRQPLPELREHKLVVSWPLEHLSTSAGVALLRQLGVRGRDTHLKAAVEEVEGHALSITLLGSYIASVEGGDIRRRNRFRLEKIMDATVEHEAEDQTDRLAKRANKIMRGYVEQLQKLEGVSAGGGDPELSLLNIVGLFDRPVDGSALAALVAEPHIGGLTDGLLLHREKVRNFIGMVKEVRERPLSPEERTQRLRFAKERLRALKIFAPATAGDPALIDAHPVVRQYFGDELKRSNAAAFATGHARLFEHYSRTGPELPDTLEEMQPLFYAIKHGCLAGSVQEAFQLYWDRISRKHDGYSVRILGAVAPMVGLLGNFFDEPWRTPSSKLSSGARRELINQTAGLLTLSGRLREALEVLDGARITEGYFRNAQYSSLLLDLGQVDQAVSAAGENLDRVNKQDGVRPKINALVQLGHALFQRGEVELAEANFAAAEVLQRDNIKQTRRQYLFSTNGFKFNRLLLAKGEYGEVIERAENSLIICRRIGNQLGIGLDQLMLAQAHAESGANDEECRRLFDAAVVELRSANSDDYLPHALLWRAGFNRANHRWEAAGEDLTEVEEIADFGEMRLFLADSALERARIAAAAGDAAGVRIHAGRARALIEETNYRLRMGEVSAIEGGLEVKQRLEVQT